MGGVPSAQDVSTLQAAVNHSPLDFRSHIRFAMALAAGGAVGRAEGEFLTARRLAPESPVVHHNLGVLYLNAGRLGQADECFCRELELSPGNGLAHYFRGLICQRRSNRSAAVAQFRLAAALAPDLPDPYLALAMAATSQEPESQIRSHVDRYVSITGNRGLADYVLSGAYRARRRYAEAAKYAEVSVAAEPGNYAYWHNLGQIYSYAHRFDDAERALTKARTVSRDPTTVLIELGMNSLAALANAKAVAYFKQALAASPATGNIHLYLARAYQRMGDQSSGVAEEREFRKWERANDERRGRGGPGFGERDGR